MTPSAGATLSQYILVEPLGEGGMGVVWKATDTTLGRSVAVKILPDDFAADPERLARFDREARLLAALNHTNIASIYGVHTHDGVRFLAMELAEGEDLAHRLARAALPVEDALPIARQIADALEFAHDRGIIHRDLKPANVMLSPDGRVKVLDFGLARALEGDVPGAQGNPSQSPTLTARMTMPSVILGTAAYMSPEQARGRTVDRRADIWAFGVVLFEMLTGRQLFEGETVSDTLAAVLRQDIDWARLPATTPRALRRLLERSLDRDPRRRLRDIGEARITLEEIEGGKASDASLAGTIGGVEGAGAPAAVSARNRLLLAALLVGGGLVLGGALVALVSSTLGPERGGRGDLPLRRFAIAGPDTAGRAPIHCAMSPDGRNVAFVRGGQMWIQDLSTDEPRAFDVEFGARRPFWSPDGQLIGYMVDTRVMKLAIATGARQVVTDLGKTSTGGDGGCWLEDGTMVVTRGQPDGLMAASQRGSAARTFHAIDSTRGEQDFHEPSPLPDGRGILFTVHRKQGPDTIGLLAGGRRKDLLTIEGQRLSFPIYSRSGHIVFHKTTPNSGIWAVPFSLSRLEITGEPILVLPGATEPSVSAEGTLVALRGGSDIRGTIALVDRKGTVKRIAATIDAGLDAHPALSPDGSQLLVSIFAGPIAELHLIDIARGARSRITSQGSGRAATWFPDGRRVVFTNTRGGPLFGFADSLVNMAASSDGSSPPESLVSPGAIPNVSPDGRWLTFSRREGKDEADLFTMSLDGDRKPVRIAAAQGIQFDGRVSPDGRWIAYISDENGRPEIYIKRFPGGEGRALVSTQGGLYPRWAGPPGRLCYVRENMIYEVSITGTDVPVISPPVPVFARPPVQGWARGWEAAYDVSRDGQTFVVFHPPIGETSSASILAVQNWAAAFEETKQRGR